MNNKNEEKIHKSPSKIEFEEDQINLKEFFNTLKRGKKIIIAFSSAGFLIGCIYALNQKRLWQGEFKIVLNNQDRFTEISNKIESNQRLAGLLGVSGGISDKETQIEILKSSSVLMPIFEYVKGEKIKSDQKYEKLKFKNWVNQSLNISLKKQTSILNISYKDTDKEIINETLRKISQKYANYAVIKKSKKLKKTINFLESQAKEYKQIAKKSFSDMVGFAIDNDLNLQGNAYTYNNEAIRIKNVNKIRNLKYQINQLESLKQYPDKLINLTKALLISYKKDNSENNLINSYEEILNDLDRKKIFYHENNREIIRLKKLKEAYENRISNRLIGLLNSELNSTYAALESAKRPKEVTLKFNYLKNKNGRDQIVLDNLEQNIQILKVQLAESIDPYEMITDITILDYPVSASRKKIAIIFTFLSLILGILVHTAKEKINGNIYEEEKIKNLIGLPFLDFININNQEKVAESINLIFQNFKNKDLINNLVLLTSNINNLKDLNKLKDNFQYNFEKFDILVTNEFSRINEYDSLILVLKIGNVTSQEVIDLKRKLLMCDIKIIGLILLEE